MPRKKLQRSEHLPYHIVSRSNHKEWFGIPLQEAWNISKRSFVRAYEKHPLVLHAFVLMGNHYHLVVHTPNADIDKFMYEFNKRFSLELRQKSGLINKMFGGRYKWSLIQGKRHYYHVMKYVFLNPVKAGITENAESYPFSTLACHLKKGMFPVQAEPFFNPSDQSFLAWLAKSHSHKQQKAIQTGLRKRVFAFSGTRDDRKPPAFESFR